MKQKYSIKLLIDYPIEAEEQDITEAAAWIEIAVVDKLYQLSDKAKIVETIITGK